MLVSMAGLDFVVNVGEVTTRFQDAEAIRLIEAGYATPVAEPVIERAVKKTASERRAK